MSPNQHIQVSGELRLCRTSNVAHYAKKESRYVIALQCTVVECVMISLALSIVHREDTNMRFHLQSNDRLVRFVVV